MLVPMPPKTILVTGAAQRLGLAIATRLAQSGHNVVLHASASLEKAERAAQQLRAAGHKAAAIGANLLVEDEVQRLIQRASEQFGRPITGLVNNASIFEGDDAIAVSAQGSDDDSSEENLELVNLIDRAKQALTTLEAEQAEELQDLLNQVEAAKAESGVANLSQLQEELADFLYYATLPNS
jgi:NAD(P)-dependent dehydrogenase (short-subunit alcohol dehydrogenase family)